MSYNYILIAFMILAITLSGLHVAFLIKRDTHAMEKYTSVTAIWVYFAAVMMYLLALHYFKQDPTYIIQALLAFVMLVCLPATLIPLSVAVITAGNV